VPAFHTRVFTAALGVLLLLALVATAATAAPAATVAKKLPSTTYVAKSLGFSITIPTKWQVVVPSVPAVQKTIAQLKKQKKTALAAAYALYIATPNARSEFKHFKFRAFQWPALPSPVPTDLTIEVTPIAKKYTAADLPGLSAALRQNLTTSTTKLAAPEMLKLPAGRAALLTGTTTLPKAYGGIKSAITLVVLVRTGRLYVLSFRIDSRAAKDAFLFTSIAQNFKFV
jgi:hypothetical protein